MSQSERPDSEEEGNSSIADALTTARSASPEEQVDDSESASSSEVEPAREAKVEQMPFDGFVQIEDEEVDLAEPSNGPEPKFDPTDEPVAVALGAAAPSCVVEDVDYYGSTWSGGMANVQGAPNLYQQQQHHHYADTTPQWYGGAGLSHHQQAHLPNCQPAIGTGDQTWSDYRHGYGQFDTVLPDKAAAQPANCHNASFEGMHQMAMPTPFAQPVTTANDAQNTIYGVSGVPYVAAPFDHQGASGYMNQHSGMYSRWQ